MGMTDLETSHSSLSSGSMLSGPMSALLPLPPVSYPIPCSPCPSASSPTYPQASTSRPPAPYPLPLLTHKGNPTLSSPCPCPTTAIALLFLLFPSLTTKATVGDPFIHSLALTPDSLHLPSQDLSELSLSITKPLSLHPGCSREQSHWILSNPPNSNSC